MCVNSSALVCALSGYLWLLLVMVTIGVLGDFAIQRSLAWLQKKEAARETLPANNALYWALAGSVGLALVSQWVFLLGLLHLLYPAAFFAGIAASVTWAFVFNARQGRLQRIAASISARGVVLVLFFLAIAAYLVALSLNAPGAWDDTSFHLPLARYFLEHHSLAVNEWLRYPLFPSNANLLFVVSLMVGNEMYAQVIANAVPLTLAAMGVYGFFAQQLKSTLFGLVAIAVLWTMRSMHESLGYAYVDGVYLLFCWTSMLATVLATQNKNEAISTTWVAVCALLTGVMVGTKLFGTVIGGATGLILLLSFGWKSRKFWLFVALSCLFGLGWYIRSFLVSGDPIHPAGTNIFGAYWWDAGDMLYQRADIHRNPNASILTIFEILIRSGATAIAIGLFVLFQPKAWRQGGFILLSYLFIYLMVWWNFFPLPRYLMAVIPAGAALAVLFAYRAGLGDFSALRSQSSTELSVLRYAEMALLLVASVWITQAAFSKAKVNIDQQPRLIQSREGYAAMNTANAHMPQLGPELVQLGFENAFYFYKGQAMGDWFGTARYRQFTVPDSATKTHMGSIVDQDTLAERTKAFGARMVVVNAKRFYFDPQQYQNRFDVQLVVPNEYFLILKP